MSTEALNTPSASAWVFDVHEIARKVGSMHEEQKTLPAPEDLKVPLIGVEPGSRVPVELRFEGVHEGVLVTGQATLPIKGECGRCLDPISYTYDAHFQELFFHPEQQLDSDDETETHVIVEDKVDLEPLLRTAVVGELPFQPLCDEDCMGLCDQCGVRLEDEPEHHHEIVDPRWEALRGLSTLGEEAPQEHNKG